MARNLIKYIDGVREGSVRTIISHHVVNLPIHLITLLLILEGGRTVLISLTDRPALSGSGMDRLG